MSDNPVLDMSMQQTKEALRQRDEALREVKSLKIQLVDAKAESRALRTIIRKVVEDMENARLGLDRALVVYRDEDDKPE